MYTRIFRPRLIFTIYGAVALQVLVYSVATHYFWQNYAEYLVAGPTSSQDAAVGALAAALQSESTRAFIDTTYRGQLVAAF